MHRQISVNDKTIKTAIYSGSAFFGLFLLLHIIESEYSPVWRFVSEYSNGHYGVVMRLAFVLSAIASLSIGIVFNTIKDSKLARAAAILFFISAFGQVLAACFNQDPVTYKGAATLAGTLHGVSTIPGILGFSIAAFLGGLWFKRQNSSLTSLFVGLFPLVSFLAMVTYLFTGISKETGFAPGTYTGLFNRVFIVAMFTIFVYFSSKFRNLHSER